ncbi:MAG TPA: MBL fold metallo-hydrolase [Gemmatimonadales bacterium]|nr:MBL fold metallo-hydrolase [Gemmatimonadales bacterium]
MSELEVVPLPNGQFGENCWLLADARTGEAVMIDPGEEPQMFLAELNTRGWSLGGIWITHGHIDHILGVAAVKRATGAPIYLHPADRPLYDSLTQQGSWFGLKVDPLPPPDRDLEAGQRLDVGGLEFTVRHTPGHSPGSVSFVRQGTIFGGDVLFNGSIGRTDLPGGDAATLLKSIHRDFLSLPDSTIVRSGHGPETTIGVERLTNPFLTGAYRLE